LDQNLQNHELERKKGRKEGKKEGREALFSLSALRCIIEIT
jgi:hypothetical protein